MPKKRNGSAAEDRSLQGWKAIGDYLGIGAAAAQRWAKSGMPVRREGRFTVAKPEEISQWIGKEAHMPAPAHVVKTDADISAALKESISALRKMKRQKITLIAFNLYYRNFPKEKAGLTVADLVVSVGYACPQCLMRVTVLSSDGTQGIAQQILSQCSCGYIRLIELDELQALEVWRDKPAV